MSLETSITKLCTSFGIALNSSAPKEIKKVVKNRSLLGGIVLAVPLFGLDAIIYAIILWSMYASVAKIAGIKFGGELIKNILGGFIVNIVVTFILNFIADWIAIIGWIGLFFVGYYATKMSGIAYLGILEAFHTRKKMKVGLDYTKMGETFKNAGGEGAAKGVVRAGGTEIVKDIFS